MNSIFDLTLDELSKKLKPSFRAKQVYSWIYKKYVTDYDSMKNLPKDLKIELKNSYPIDLISVQNKEISDDGTIKYLFKLHDNHTIEAVLLLMKKKAI